MAARIGSWWKRRKHPSVWVIKQLDESLIHLCGQARLQGAGSGNEKLDQLRAGTFSGAVRMAENGAVLNAAQFAVLIPQTDLLLIDDGHAEWQGRQWQIAWVPQRCWLHDGPLVAQAVGQPGHDRLISVEDVSGIRAKAEPPNYRNAFLTLEPLEQPRRESDDRAPQRIHRDSQDKNGHDA